MCAVESTSSAVSSCHTNTLTQSFTQTLKLGTISIVTSTPLLIIVELELGLHTVPYISEERHPSSISARPASHTRTLE